MAIIKTVEIVAKTKQAASDIKDLFDDLLKKELKAQEATDDLGDSFDGLGKDATKSLKNIEKGVENTEKSTSSLAKGFKGVGVAIKAVGIGLIISAFTTLKEVFTQNQKVADALSSAFETVNIVFNEVTSVVVDVFEKVSKATNGMEGLKNVIGGLITISLTPLKATFYSVGLAISELQLAWEESFFGDDDPETIKKLTKRIESQKNALVEVGESAIEAGSKVANNIGKAITEVGAIVEGTVEGVSKISISSAYENAKANVQLENTAKLAEAQQARLVEQYDRQAEKLRQVRDNDLNSVSERQKANDELLVVLNKQEQAMLAQASAQIASAQANFNKNKSIENQVELTKALGNREGVLAQIEGFRSEQDSNKNALIKEQLDLIKTKTEAETDNAINQKLFEAERLKDEQKRLQAEKEAIEFQRQKKLEELQSNIELYKEGTQARLDAEKEYNAQKQELDNAVIAKEDEIALFKENKKLEKNALDLENEALAFDEKLALLKERDDLILANETLTEEERTKLLKENSDARITIAKEEAAAKLAMLNAVSSGLSLASQELGESTAAGKLAAVAAASISTYTAIAGQLAAFSGVPIPGYAIAQAIVTGATGLLQVKKILSVKTPKGGGGGSAPSIGGAGGGGTIPQTAPQFNVVGNTGVNQIEQSLGRQQPIQAYVVANNVTTAQSLDRNIITNASLG